ncbi:MAG: metal ABC transporter permease [Candidatus Moraniibacteriota bacterium]|nr:MAG: metal ABC transporter permease [Candidatus Moranbacteria bacterium]
MIENIFQYSFILRGLEAGIIVACVAPLIGTFLVLRRYSLIADTLSHVSLAGIALGLLLKVNPLLMALGATTVASLGIERLRNSKRVYGESALALFLSGSLALAVVLLSLANGFNSSLFNYLFGSIVTVTENDVLVIGVVSAFVIIVLFALFKPLLYVTFDEEAAQVSGMPTRFLNLTLILLTALTVSVAIPIVGVLLIAALMVIPVIAALQWKRGFTGTIIIAEIISILSVLTGIIASFYLNLATGGTIVLIMLFAFIISLFVNRQ